MWYFVIISCRQSYKKVTFVPHKNFKDPVRYENARFDSGPLRLDPFPW